MRIRRISIRQAPGLPSGVRTEALNPRLTVILGPNASGKSTLARALRGALWPEAAPPEILGEVEVETPGSTAVATLRWGTVSWDPAPPPLPGPEALALARLELPALLVSGEAEERLAHRIAVELAGGYDLQAALDEVAVPSPRRGELQAALDEVRKAARAAERELERLAEREKEVPHLQAELAQARAARDLLRLADRAVELAGLRAELAEVEAILPALPPGLDRLRGDEAERLAQIRQRVHQTEEEIARLDAGFTETREELVRLRFAGDPPGAEALAAWAERARRLEERAREADRLRRELAAAREEAAEAARGLLREPGQPVSWNGVKVEELEAALEKLRDAQGDLKVRQAEHQVWEGYAREADPAEIPRLERTVGALRRWLARRRTAISPAPGWLAAAAGAVLAAASLALAWPPAALAAGTGLLGAGLAWLLAGRRAGRGGQPAARELPDELAPASWTEEAVREALDRVEERLATARLAREAGRRAREAAALLEERRHEVENTLTPAVAAAATELGLDPELPTLVLLEQAHRLERWHRAESGRVRIEAELRAVEEETETARAELDGWLASLGCEPAGGAEGASAAVEAVTARLDRLRTAEGRLRELERNLEAARERAHRDREELAGVWERTDLAPGQEAELERRLEALPRFRELGKRQAELAARIAPLEAELEGRWKALGLDPGTLQGGDAEARRDELAARAGRVEELVGEITTIENSIAAASGGDWREAARSAVAEAALAVAERRDEAMVGVLTRLVLERAREAVAREHAPAVLERARGWFARFTRGAFRLGVDAGGRLHAVDTAEGARRGLEQLSDGTRIHLLLAARLAALEQAEGTAGPLPLVLDEALSTTDPGRFREIAAALAGAAARGRQVLYLTADPTEAEHWRQACAEAGLPEPAVVELAPAPAGQGWKAPQSAPAPPPPAPGEDAAAYARRLGAPPPDPFAGVDTWHPVWLLPDHLAAVHRLLAAGISRLGAWKELHRAGAALLEPPQAALLRARARLAREALEAWRVGRGRPVSWDQVAASGAVSERFEGDVRELVERHGRDPQRLVAEVRTLKGFRAAKAEQLEAHLEAEGILDRREPLSGDAVLARALASAEAALAEAGIDPAEAARWLRGLLDAIGQQ